MRLVIKMTDHKRWPRMYVENLITDSGDKVCLQNWAMQRRNDFIAICDEHAKATDRAMAAVKENRSCRAVTLRNMFEEVFARPKDNWVPPERNTVANTADLRKRALDFIKGYVVTDNKQVYSNGMEFVPLQRVEDMLNMMQTGDFTYKGS